MLYDPLMPRYAGDRSTFPFAGGLCLVNLVVGVLGVAVGSGKSNGFAVVEGPVGELFDEVHQATAQRRQLVRDLGGDSGKYGAGDEFKVDVAGYHEYGYTE